MPTKSTAAERTRAASEPGTLVLLCLASWVVPGSGHLWMGRRQKGFVFLFAIPMMFLVGLLLHGRIFPFELSEPLVGLAAVANLGAGAPWLLARMLEAGGGVVTASSYEYGNCFLIVAGLLNFLVILDAFDIGMGRK
jgi:cytochrome bd-type quinol oxidase subunit 2